MTEAQQRQLDRLDAHLSTLYSEAQGTDDLTRLASILRRMQRITARYESLALDVLRTRSSVPA